jgi:predicted signal transduction protein with EAL and GGDEF domain
MNIEQAVLEKLRQLPVDKQQQLLDFAEFLSQKTTSKMPLRSVRGLCADLKVDITEEDIAQARQEMWGNFPRDLV